VNASHVTDPVIWAMTVILLLTPTVELSRVWDCVPDGPPNMFVNDIINYPMYAIYSGDIHRMDSKSDIHKELARIIASI